MASSIRSARDSSLPTRLAPEELTIDDWPLRDRPLASLLAFILAAGASWLVAWATANVAAGGAVAVLLVLTLWRSWLPVRYQLGPSGVVQSVLGRQRRIPWTAIRSHEIRTDGVVLLPEAESTSLGAMRGLYLHWAAQREGVLAHLDYYLTPRSRSPAGSSLGTAPARRGP